MWVDTSHPANLQILQTLASRKAQLIAAWDSVPDSHQNCGHPDVVWHVWDKIGSVLPKQAVCLLRGSPALVLPVSGVVVAFCYGTEYCLRIPTGSMAEVLKNGARTVTEWTGGKQTDIQKEFGPDWVFGSFNSQELTCCALVALEYEEKANDSKRGED